MNREIAKILDLAPQIINNEVKRGTIIQLKRQKQDGKIHYYYYHIYDAKAGLAAYEKHRLNCGRRPKWANADAFVEWADDKMLDEKLKAKQASKISASSMQSACRHMILMLLIAKKVIRNPLVIVLTSKKLVVKIIPFN